MNAMAASASESYRSALRPDAPTEKRLKVLTVDDNHFDRRMLIRCLMKHDKVKSVSATPDPREALHWLTDHGQDTDLVLLDIAMPVMTGYELLSAASNVVRRHGITAVMVSSSSRPADMKASLQTVASGYLIKPDSFAKMQRATDFIVECVANDLPIPDFVNGLADHPMVRSLH